MQNLVDEDIRRVLEDSDGEDTLFNVYDHEEIVEDDDVDYSHSERKKIYHVFHFFYSLVSC